MKSTVWLLLTLFTVGALISGTSTMAAEHGKGKGKEKDKEKKSDEDKDADKGEGNGKSHAEKSTPPGWDKGKKTGWRDEYPPGWDKKSNEEKAKWNTDLESARQDVAKACEEKKMKDEEKTQMQEALERIARKGKAIETAKEETVGAIQKAKSAFEVLKENGIVLETGQ